jgi:outer membrane protein assembly factor BamB
MVEETGGAKDMLARSNGTLRVCAGIAAAAVFTLGAVAESSAADAIMDIELLASATADECYVDVGNPLNTWYGFDGWPAGGCDIGTNADPKVNQAYIWGLALCGDVLWFGTAANPACMVQGTYLDMADPSGGNSSVCEFGVSQFPEAAALPEAYRDWRPPDLFKYDTGSNTLTPLNGWLDPDGNARRWNTLGIRSAGCHNGVVFLGGPVLPTGDTLAVMNGVNLFAFDADNGLYLGSTTLEGYSDIRSWVVAQDNLYTGMLTMLFTGEILRWTGNKANPFQFQTVGYLPCEPAYFAEHDGRLLVTTWPGLLRQGAGLWMSPRIPNGGLRRWHALWWRELWNSDEYEPDELLNLSYGGGPVASFDGCIFWGTMHVPYLGYQIYTLMYGEPETDAGQRMLQDNTLRTTSVFRGSLVRRAGLWGWLVPDFDYDLLYGEPEFTVWTNPDLGTNGWETVPNNMGGVEPLYGPMGFEKDWRARRVSGVCNYYQDEPSSNFYSWSSAVANGQLFWGTLDLYSGDRRCHAHDDDEGADLWRFPSCDEPAVPEFIDGAGNSNLYGVRNMVSDGTNLYLGMATQVNLRTEEGGDSNPGGWKLLKLTPLPPP